MMDRSYSYTVWMGIRNNTTFVVSWGYLCLHKESTHALPDMNIFLFLALNVSVILRMTKPSIRGSLRQ
jgi:hypothetical protein